MSRRRLKINTYYVRYESGKLPGVDREPVEGEESRLNGDPITYSR
jgi:hypothetical protein